MAENKNKVAAVLRNYAEKLASEKKAAGEGAPDRLTVADGQGGITTQKGTVPKDVGEEELKRDMPADATGRTAAAVPSGGPDRLTVADGQGGITAAKGSIPKDVGEGELKADLPADGEVRKAAGASERVNRIRAAVMGANPAVAARINKSAGVPAAAPQKQAAAPAAPAAVPFDQETLAKIASVVLSTDEGVRFTHDLLEKQAGEEAARVQILEAIEAANGYNQTEQIKQAAFADLQTKWAAVHQNLEAAGVTERDAEEILKQAAFHQAKIDSLEHPLLKSAYAEGMDDAALLSAADESAGAEGVPPVDEAMPMGGEDLSEEEILALLEEMIASGQITEEDVQAAIAATSGEGGGEGELPPADAGGEAPPAPAPEAPPTA